ncbi:MAG: hypothetical protein QM702_17535 [Rubrivivax sp.]
MKTMTGAARYASVAFGLVVSTFAASAASTDTVCERIQPLEVSYRDFSPTQVEIVQPCPPRDDRLPYVLFVSYVALVDKDYYSGENPDDAVTADRQSDIFLFAALARELNAKGFTAIKYDAIAVHAASATGGNGRTDIVSQDELLRVEREDFSGLLHSVIQAADLALGTGGERPVIFVAHSGGAFTVADYFARFSQGRDGGRKLGFVGISPSVSADTGTKPSYRDYWIRSLQQCLQHNEKSVCWAQWNGDKQFVRMFNEGRRQRIAEIFAGSTEETQLIGGLNAYLTTVAAEIDAENKASSEGVGYLNNKYQMRNELFNSMFFRQPSATPISCRSNASRLIYGSGDFAMSGEVEREAWESACGKPEQLVLLDGVGHCLGQDRYFGPIRQEAKAVVVDSILKVADELR